MCVRERERERERARVCGGGGGRGGERRGVRAHVSGRSADESMPSVPAGEHARERGGRCVRTSAVAQCGAGDESAPHLLSRMKEYMGTNSPPPPMPAPAAREPSVMIMMVVAMRAPIGSSSIPCFRGAYLRTSEGEGSGDEGGEDGTEEQGSSNDCPRRAVSHTDALVRRCGSITPRRPAAEPQRALFHWPLSSTKKQADDSKQSLPRSRCQRPPPDVRIVVLVAVVLVVELVIL